MSHQRRTGRTPVAHRGRSLSRAGFTLIELLVSVVLLVIVIFATFGFMTSMSGVFYSQDMIVDAQSSARFALDFVSSDVRRAGYLTSANAPADNQVCPPPVGFNVPVSAINIGDGADAGQVFGVGAPNNNDAIEPDRLTLMGAFDSPHLYTLDGVTRTSAVINGASAAFNLGNGTVAENSQAFDTIFVPGRMVRVSDVDGSSQFAILTAASFNGGRPSLALNGLVERSGNRGCGLEGVSGQSYELSVVNVYRYQIQARPGQPQIMDLMRTELDARTGNPLRIDGRVNQVPVAEYVVDFQVLAFGDNGPDRIVPLIAPDLMGDDEGSLSFNFLEGGGPQNSRWHRIRALKIYVSVRTQREDPNLTHVPRQLENSTGGTNYGLLTSFDTDGDPLSSAHVVTMSTFIETPNLTFANL